LATGERIEAFLADLLALAGEEQDAVREGVHVALADCEAILRARETNKRMKEPSRSRQPRTLPHSRRRGNASTQRHGMAVTPRRFPPPWSAEETDALGTGLVRAAG
jgi:hypothetical protein